MSSDKLVVTAWMLSMHSNEVCYHCGERKVTLTACFTRSYEYAGKEKESEECSDFCDSCAKGFRESTVGTFGPHVVTDPIAEHFAAT